MKQSKDTILMTKEDTANITMVPLDIEALKLIFECAELYYEEDDIEMGTFTHVTLDNGIIFKFHKDGSLLSINKGN